MASNASSKRRPLIGAADKDLLGSHRESSAFRDGSGVNQDVTFIKGYSDRRRRIDADLSAGREPKEGLDYRLQWVRCQRPNGKMDMQAVTQYRAKGYRFVKPGDCAELGIEAPLHSEPTADGKIQIGDVVLMICDADTAAAHMEDGQSAIQERSAADYTSQELHTAGRELGAGSDLATSTLQQRTEVTRKG